MNSGEFISNLKVIYFITERHKEINKKKFCENIHHSANKYFILKNEYFSICCKKDGTFEFEINTNINKKDIDKIYNKYVSNVTNYNTLLDHYIWDKKEDDIYIKEEKEKIDLATFYFYKLDKKIELEKLTEYIKNKIDPDHLKKISIINMELDIYITCTICSGTNDSERIRIVHIYIMPDTNVLEIDITNRDKLHYHNRNYLYFQIDNKLDLSLAPTVDSIEDVLALKGLGDLKNLSESNLINVYKDAQILEENEYLYYSIYNTDEIDKSYLKRIKEYFFKKDEIVKFLNYNNITVHMHDYKNMIGQRHFNRKYNIINNKLTIKNINSKIEPLSNKTLTYQSEINDNDKIVLQVLFRDEDISQDNKKILLELFKFLDTLKSDFEKDTLCIDIVKYKIIGKSNEYITNEFKCLNKYKENQGNARAFISRAKSSVIEKIKEKFGEDIDFPYIDYRQSKNKNKIIDKYYTRINDFWDYIKNFSAKAR